MNRHLHLILLPLVKLALHLGTYRGYGMFRDEFYYLAGADRLAWGYVDHPPFSLLVLKVVTTIFGDSLFAVRLVPALTGAATVLLVGLIARRLGGGRAAQALAMLAALVAPIYLALDHFYSMNAIDTLIWALAAYLVLDVIEREHARRPWVLLGLVLGIGLLNKMSVLWLGAGLLVGLLASDRRRLLRSPGPWIAAGIALALFMPHLVWQIANDWPTVEFVRNASQNKMVAVAPLDFLMQQVRMMNYASFPVWVSGFVWLLRDRQRRGYRVLGVAYVTVFLLLILNGTSRAGYLAASYTWLLPAGAVALQGLLNRWHRAPLWSYATLLATAGIVFLPFSIPVLPVERYIAYAAAMGIGPSTAERKELSELPQHYADMHGWQEIADTVTQVYQSLSPEDRARAAIFTENYGDAGAIAYFGRRAGVPHPIGGHNNYWLWGPGEHTGEVVLFVGSDREDLEAAFEHVEAGAVIDCGLCMPYENNRTIWIAHGMRAPIADVWPGLKHYN